jgi:formylglycine-generating enzyme required for sulfatase activity
MIKKIFLLGFVIFLVTAFVPKKKKEFLPPGTVQINDTLYADETEVSNFSWLEYQWWIFRKYGYNSPQYKAVLPDTLVWRDSLITNEPYVKYYLRHSAYRDYPVVGISYEQAIEFCKWRTERVMEYMAISKKYSTIDFEYRLPTKREWEFISNNGMGYFSNGGKGAKGKITSNHRWAKDSIEAKKGYQHNYPEVTAPEHSYEKNLFGLFHMIGNVAEMVNEKGISKGGSWRHRLEQCRVGKDIPYTKPTAWLGFRCVCVVKKNRC